MIAPKFLTNNHDGEEESKDADNNQELSYEQTCEAEVYLLQLIAPIIEGSSQTKAELLDEIKTKIDSLNLSESIKLCLKEPEELLLACFT